MNRQLPKTYALNSFDTMMHLTFFSCDAQEGEEFVLKLAKPLYANYNVDLDRVVSALVKHTTLVNPADVGHAGGINNPYHNYVHCLRVGIAAFHLVLNEFRYELNLPNDLRLILIAGLFHDANHTGGKLFHEGGQHDSVNIQRAIDAFRAVNLELNLCIQDDAEVVCSLIRDTEFPSPVPKDFRSLCLRDADLLSMMWPDREHILAALGAEQQMEIGLDQNTEFLKNAGYLTKGGRRVLEFLKNKPWIITQLSQEEYDANMLAADCDADEAGDDEADNERFALPA